MVREPVIRNIVLCWKEPQDRGRGRGETQDAAVFQGGKELKERMNLNNTSIISQVSYYINYIAY